MAQLVRALSVDSAGGGDPKAWLKKVA